MTPHSQKSDRPNVFRIASTADISAIAAFTSKADAGLTTVPKTEAAVADYIAQTERFLAGDQTANRVLFVAQCGNDILGISGIIPKLGLERPFYSFKRSHHSRRSTLEHKDGHNLAVKYDTLQLTTDFDGYTELASIFLAPHARGRGVARLLSLGRLGFIESHRDIFESGLMADIRGWVDTAGRSPFWEHLTSKFIQTDFDVADRLSATDGRFIMELLPSLPIMLNLLPESVDACAGKPHDLSAGAMGLLMSAGFEKTDLCDIFDGGPAIKCKTDSTIIARTKFQARSFSCDEGSEKYLHFTGRLTDFKAAIGTAEPAEKNANKNIADVLGKALNVALANDRRGLRQTGRETA